MSEITLEDVVTVENSAEVTAFRQRIDYDMKLWYLEQYVMKDKNNEPLPHVVNVTVNEPATYADRCVALLGGAKRKLAIGGLESDDEKEVEGYYRQVFKNCDELLSIQMIEDLKFALDWYSCIEGWINNRILVMRDGDVEVVEIMPFSSRWTAWQVDRRGLLWSSDRFRMDQEAAEETYQYKLGGKLKKVDIVEIWTRDYLKAYLNNKEAGKWLHNFGKPPKIILPVRTKPNTIDAVSTSRGFSSQGESIYRANRELYNKASEMASIWATMNKMQFMAPLQYISPQGRKLGQRPYGFGIVVNLKQNEKLLEIPVKEMTASGQNLFGQYMGWLQRGGLTHVEYGELSFELSAVAISRLSEAKDQIFKPRLNTESMFEERACKMIRQQHLAGGYPVKLDDDTKELAVKAPASIKKIFSVTVEFHAVYPEQNIANLTVAQAAQNFVSIETILDQYLHVDNPADELARLNLQKLYKGVPELFLMDTALDLAPVKKMNTKARDAMRSNLIRWKLQKLTGGQVQMDQLNISQETSQPRIRGLETAMPRTPAVHANKENLRRSNIRAKEEGFEANE